MKFKAEYKEKINIESLNGSYVDISFGMNLTYGNIETNIIPKNTFVIDRSIISAKRFVANILNFSLSCSNNLTSFETPTVSKDSENKINNPIMERARKTASVSKENPNKIAIENVLKYPNILEATLIEDVLKSSLTT